MDHITDMRKVLAIVALLASSACGTATGWQKPGTEQSLVDGDLRQCRREAVQETASICSAWSWLNSLERCTACRAGADR